MEDTAAKRRMYLLLALTAVIWGIQPLCIKWLVAEWSPVTISAMRYIFISAALLVIAVRRGETLLPPRHTVPALMAMGMTGILMNGCMQFTGLQYSTVTNCTLIAAASPAITAFFAAVCLRERLNIIAWLGIAVSFLGALAVVSHGSWQVLVGFSFNYGDILFLLAQVAWTVYSILAVRVMRHISAALCTGWAGAFGALATILYGILTDDFHPTVLPFPLLAAFLYTVVFGGVMAMLFWNLGVRCVGSSVTSIFQNVTPVVGMIGGVLLFAEVIGTLQILGAAAIFGGVYLTTHANFRENKKQQN